MDYGVFVSMPNNLTGLAPSKVLYEMQSEHILTYLLTYLLTSVQHKHTHSVLLRYNIIC